MKKNTLFCMALLVVTFSCEEANEEVISNEAFLLENLPQAPPTQRFDLNNDGVDDFQLLYRLFIWDGINSTGYGLSGNYHPLGDNLMLQKRSDDFLVIPLFNKFNDTV